MALYRQTVTISNGTSISAAAPFGPRKLVGIVMPAAWDAAAITFQMSPDDANFTNLYDKGGTEYSVTAAAAKAHIIPMADTMGLQNIKLRSGTAASPVNQTADRVITLILADY